MISSLLSSPPDNFLQKTEPVLHFRFPAKPNPPKTLESRPVQTRLHRTPPDGTRKSQWPTPGSQPLPDPPRKASAETETRTRIRPSLLHQSGARRSRDTPPLLPQAPALPESRAPTRRAPLPRVRYAPREDRSAPCRAAGTTGVSRSKCTRLEPRLRACIR